MEVRETDDGNVAVLFSKDSEECQLSMPITNDMRAESENCISIENQKQTSKMNDAFHSFSGLYAEILLVVTAASVLSEILHRDLPLFYIHDYVFLYIFGMGILLLTGAYAKHFCGSFIHASEENEEKLRVPSLKSACEMKTFDIGPFFKIGCFVFGAIVILVSSLEIISIFVSPKKCLNSVNAFPPILRCVFILLQIIFLKNSEKIISSFGFFRNLALMHLFAANGATWIRLLLWECARDWEDAVHLKLNSSANWHKLPMNLTVHSLESNMTSDSIENYPSHVVHYTSNCYWKVQKTEEMDVTSVLYCLQHSTVGFLWERTNQFLYPFMAQYYFIITGILYIMWVNYNVKRKHITFDKSNNSSGAEMRSRSTKGCFLGCIVLTTTIIILLIFFTVHKNFDMMISTIYSVIFTSSSFAALLGLTQIKKMYTWKSSKDIQFIKLFQKIGLFAVFVYGSCGLICEGLSKEKQMVILVLSTLGMIVHGSLQYLFIVQVSRKKVDVSNIREKPGRQVVVFLIFCNFSLWILDSFITWNHLKRSTQHTFDPLWSVVTRCMLPVVIFYRFHSVVTLIKAWSKTYG